MIGFQMRRIARLPAFVANGVVAGLGAVTLCLTFLGCAAGPGAAPPTQSAAPTTASNSCAQAESPPADLAKQPDYRQVVVLAQSQTDLPPPTLTAKDLRFYQGDKGVQIAFFHPQAVAVAIVVDTSGSMETKLPMCRSALEAFINDLDPSDEVSLFAFSDVPFLLAKATTDHASVVKTLPMLHAYGRTALYDSLIASMHLLSNGCAANRALLLITDGIDDSSSASLDQTVETARKTRVPIYSIGIGNPRTQTTYIPGSKIGDIDALDTKAITALATDTGGETFTVTLKEQGAGLKQAATAIARKIGNRYVVGFIGDGSTSQLRIEAPGNKALVFKIESAKP